jgi:hypothetical protein
MNRDFVAALAMLAVSCTGLNDGDEPETQKDSGVCAAPCDAAPVCSGSSCDAEELGPRSRRDSGSQQDAGAAGGKVDAGGTGEPDPGEQPEPDAGDPPNMTTDSGPACEPNACTGCGPLSAAIGAPCGACGAYACDMALGDVACADPGANACGGCTTLSAELGRPCGGPCGTYACDSPNALRCNDPGLNACNGCGRLDNQPGGSCSGCGTWKCSGEVSVTCDLTSCAFACGDALPAVTFPTVLTGSGSAPLAAGGAITEGVYRQTRVTIYGTYSSVPGDSFELRNGYFHQRHTTYSSAGSALTGYELIGTYAATGAAMALDVTNCQVGSGPTLWKFTANGDQIQLFSSASSTTWVQTFQRVP